MIKIYIKRFFEFAGFFLICLVGIVITSKIFVPKWMNSDNNYEKQIVDGFYDQKRNTIDVMFVGNSDMYDGVSPMELWGMYGIAGYNYSHPSSRTWTDYYSIKMILERQKPKYIFLGADSFFTVERPRNGDNAKPTTSMRMSKAKVKMLMDKNTHPSIRTKISYIFPIIRFHSRYNDLTKDDFKYAFKSAYMPTKGFVITTKIKPLKNTDYMNKKKKVEKIPRKNRKYLDMIVELCKKNNVKLVFLETPSADSWNHKRHDAVEKYAQDNDVLFFDMNYYIDEIGLDWKTDSKDGGNHLNLYGAIKVSDYIAEYIHENLEIPDRRSDKKYKNWHKEYKEYTKLKEENLNAMAENKK